MEENNVLATVRSNRSATPQPQAATDLSAEIMHAVDRQPGDRIKCRRVAPNTYRCNWLAPELTTDSKGGVRFLETYRIRDSKFLRVTKVDGRLVIEDMTVQSARSN